MYKWRRFVLKSASVILVIGIILTWFFHLPLAVAQEQANQTALVIHSGTLRVFNNTQMITEDGGEVEIIPLFDDDQSMPIESELLDEVIIEVGEPVDNNDTSIENPEIGPEKVITIIKSGTLVVYDDGRILTEGGGRVEFIVDEPGTSLYNAVIEDETEYISSTLVNVPIDEETLSKIPNAVVCYIHISWRSIGPTTYKRQTDYCVNDEGNEIVKTIRITNTGSEYTPKLNSEALTACGQIFYQWVKSGPWIIGPGATLRLEPWKEIYSWWERDGKVIEEWQGKTIGTCIPD